MNGCNSFGPPKTQKEWFCDYCGLRLANWEESSLEDGEYCPECWDECGGTLTLRDNPSV